MSGWVSLLGYAIGGLAVLAAAIYTSRATARSDRRTEAMQAALEEQRSRVDQVRVDGEAYDRARQIMNDLVTGLRAELVRLQAEVVELRIQLGAESAKVRRLQAAVDRMKALLDTNHIPMPEGIDL